MEQYDVVVMGLDPLLSREAVIAAVAHRLSTSLAEVEQRLDEAPAVLVRGVSEPEARRLVTELRELGARVKPRAVGSELASIPAPSSSRPPSSPRPRREPHADIELSSLAPIEASGLELDLPLPEPRAASVVPRALSVAPHAPRPIEKQRMAEPSPLRPQPSALSPRLVEVADKPERPRAFWTALHESFLVPFRGHALYGLLGAPCLAVAAMVAGVVGTRLSMLSALVALVLAFAFVGTMLQVARRCLWATAVGERVPDPLPSDLMSDYVFTGAGVLIAQAVFGGISAWLSYQLIQRGAPELSIDGLWVFIGLYGVIGFALSAANGSATGYLDVARILRILVRAPVHVLVIAVLGAIVQGGAMYLAGQQMLAAMATGDFGTIFLSLGVVGFVVSFGTAYGAALTATMMGMLFYAKPEVAN